MTADDLPESQRRLLDDLQEAGAPGEMIESVRELRYHDFESELPMPKHQLITDCKQAGLHEIAQKAMDGEYDDEAPEGTTDDIVDWMMEGTDAE